jgi:S-adenosylmethionine synthetase
VTEGHPDKIADQVSDAVLDAVIKEDHRGRVACETLVTTGMTIVAGEITTKANINIPAIARETIKKIGYDNPSLGFDWENCAVITCIDPQSPDIALGVNREDDKDQGAGDQGIMFGYACRETEELMPMPILFAHRLTKKLSYVRKNKILDFLRPDGKSQVTIEYVEDKPKRVDTIVISSQHSPDVKNETIKEGIIEEVIKRVIPAELLDNNTKYLINPTGRFVIGGPKGDCGLTGRKIIVDTYGGQARHGGGCFSGKDPSKVDRSASYMARYIAKNIVASGLANKCEVQIAYAIGMAEPVSVMVDTFGTGKIKDEKLANIVKEVFDMRPYSIIKTLDLLRPIYRNTAVYGHFGRNEPEFTWERVDKINELIKCAGR